MDGASPHMHHKMLKVLDAEPHMYDNMKKLIDTTRHMNAYIYIYIYIYIYENENSDHKLYVKCIQNQIRLINCM